MLRRIFFTALLLLALAPNARAASSAWQKDEALAVRLISGVDAVGDSKTVPLGLDVVLAPDWHTYWRTPGDAGLPPALDWKKSLNDDDNLAEARLRYPTPHRYSAFGMETIGYRDHVIFPIDASLREPGKALTAATQVDLLVCKDICVPKHFALSLTLPAGEAKKSKEAAALQEAQASLPGSPESSGLAIRRVERFPDKIILTVKAVGAFTEPDLFLENDKDILFDRPQITLSKDSRIATFTLTPSDELPNDASLMNLPITVTIVNGTAALEASIGELFQPQGLVSRYAPLLKLLGFAALAMLGGFILNLTPCVLPVLSLKMMSLLQNGGKSEGTVRRSFFTTALGILFSFFLLGLGMVALKMTGKVVGWGIQFQQPSFLVFLILILTLFTANLWDLFEISLPSSWINKLDPHEHPKRAGDFITGAFATLLATPCSAPFLGTAVAFALAAGWRKILVIFMALGFGMAIPYLAVALFPHLARALPKPGAWMVILRRILGLSLLASALWLLRVLGGEIAYEGMVTVGTSMLIIVIGLALHHVAPRPRFAVAIVAMATIIAFAASLVTTPPLQKIDAAWEVFDESAIQKDILDGKIVFVDITADWCLTCKANKKITLNRQEVATRLFNDPKIIPMQADWTNPDPKITAFLQRHNRYGVPFDAVFGPKAPQGVMLPEILTPAIVLKAIHDAETGPCNDVELTC